LACLLKGRFHARRSSWALRNFAAKKADTYMKHQYFGDINDYRKYGLLRLLVRGTPVNK
jgi:hypothetical protein